MKLHILSDLHVDVRPIKDIPQTDADVVIVAGDVQQGAQRSADTLARKFPGQRVLSVAGNHTFYGSSIQKERHHSGHLENQAVLIDGIRFLGCTLWTDYELDGYPLLSKVEARRGMNDFRYINFVNSPWERFLPKHAQRLHDESIQFLEEQFSDSLPTVVITHHAPHPNSIHPKYYNNPLNASYASDLTEQILRWKPLLWIHGHVHDSFDYMVGETRVVCNPHGYGDENPNFNPELIIDI